MISSLRPELARTHCPCGADSRFDGDLSLLQNTASSKACVHSGPQYLTTIGFAQPTATALSAPPIMKFHRGVRLAMLSVPRLCADQMSRFRPFANLKTAHGLLEQPIRLGHTLMLS